MQILGIVGSMRKNRYTNTLVNEVIREMKDLDHTIDADIIYTADKSIHPCRVVCSSYCTNNPFQCSISDDAGGILSQMIEADGLVIGAPLYFRAPPVQFQALIERLISIFFYYEAEGKGNLESPLKGKPCGLVGVAEYSNPHQILEYLHDFCTVLKMKPVTLDKLPYLGVAGQGNVEIDENFKPFDRSKDMARALVEEIK